MYDNVTIPWPNLFTFIRIHSKYMHLPILHNFLHNAGDFARPGPSAQNSVPCIPALLFINF